MGYSPGMFADIAKLGLPKGAKVIDIGSQDVQVMSLDDLKTVNEFILNNDGVPFPDSIKLPATIEALDVYERAGFKYLRSDVDERPKTIYVDLNRLVFPAELKATMDLVVNVGTTEHLANPVGGFFLMHYLAKPGGILFSDVPIFGYGNHGLTNPTPKFWHALLWMNAYELVDSAVRRTDESVVDQGNFYHDYLGYIKGLGDVRNISCMIRFVVRKKGNRVFIPPYDAVLPESDGSKEANLVMGALYPFVATGAISQSEAEAGVNDFLVMMCKPYRTGNVMIRSRSALKTFLIAARHFAGRVKRALLPH